MIVFRPGNFLSMVPFNRYPNGINSIYGAEQNAANWKDISMGWFLGSAYIAIQICKALYT